MQCRVFNNLVLRRPAVPCGFQPSFPFTPIVSYVRFLHSLAILGLLLSGLFLFTNCADDATDAGSATSTAPATPPRKGPRPNAKPVPRFDADSAYAYVAKQVAFGPRVMNTAAHDATAEWLVDKLKAFGAEVEEQKFTVAAYDGTPLKSNNIIGRYKPELTDRIALAAHWDTRPVADSKLEDDPNAVVEGADDGASGVGVLLEIARQLGMSTPDIGVDIILFDAEDYGQSGEEGGAETYGLGSQYWSRNLPEKRPRYGILLDMVGAKGARFAKEGFSMQAAPQLVDRVWKLAADMNFGTYFPDIKQRPITDDHYFVNTIARIPMIDIINFSSDTDSGFVPHWHTGDDGMDVIDKETLRAVGQVVTAVVYRDAAGTF